MTYDEITLFRRFLAGKGTLNNFEYLYAHHRFKPISIDAYLEQIDPEDAILNAFDMGEARNTIFNFQYWKSLDEKWQRKLCEFRQTGEITEDATIRCGQCGRLLPKSAFKMRTNGLLHKHCKECESGEFARRKKAAEELIAEQRRAEEAERSRRKDIEHSLNYAAEATSRFERQECSKPVTTTQKTKKVEDFTFYDFDKKSNLTNSIGPNKFAINNKKGNYTLVMNIEDSQAIIDANLLRLRLRRDNITGALHLVFNSTVGAPCVIRNKKNVAVGNKELVEFLIGALGYPVTTERVIVDITDNLSRINDCITFLVKRTKK